MLHSWHSTLVKLLSFESFKGQQTFLHPIQESGEQKDNPWTSKWVGITVDHDIVTAAQAEGCGTTLSSPGRAKILLLPLGKDREGRLGRSGGGEGPGTHRLGHYQRPHYQPNRNSWEGRRSPVISICCCLYVRDILMVSVCRLNLAITQSHKMTRPPICKD